MADKRRMTIYLDADLARQVRVYAVKRDRSVSDVIADAVARLLEQQKADVGAGDKR